MELVRTRNWAVNLILPTSPTPAQPTIPHLSRAIVLGRFSVSESLSNKSMLAYDDALAETLNGLYKAEVIWRQQPWSSVSAVEVAHPALGRLVQPPPPARPHRIYPARRGRSQPRCSQRDHRYSRMTQLQPPPENLGRFILRAIVCSSTASGE